ncbi:hypothetical protein DFA_11488 [Cavenderia fasciculata]|uniref:Uncharacterized protein n=1 Tax=Cavenderia fasciculata TaxID=261658 RepID=F4QD99_CACFS|nr:uncharacterized protein DFA_11488 [Cavenderia fasciculata]EGG13727.1 hypothetical protein DFA_11488 [Cavenderia fasciculata]|eukprot:XP_004350431.1 hypothetical protein DFA_11488 [Cavenderia fasciculata]
MKFLLSMIVLIFSLAVVLGQGASNQIQWNSGQPQINITIQAGDSVTWSTTDNSNHTVTHVASSGGLALFDATIKGTNENPGTYTFQFNTDGVYNVVDSNDSNLKSTITVGNSTSTTTGSTEPSTTGSAEPSTTGAAANTTTTTGTPNNQLSTTGSEAASKEHSTTGAAVTLANNQILSLMVVLFSLIAVLL